MSEGGALAIVAGVFVAFFVGVELGERVERHRESDAAGCLAVLWLLAAAVFAVVILRLMFLGATR